MLGTLTRYLRFMGYDTMSANSLTPGSTREDTLLLEIASRDDRLLLTRDRELARRGGAQAVYIDSEEVMDQIRQVADLGLIEPTLRMSRCSLCNTRLRPATVREDPGGTLRPAVGPREGVLVVPRVPETLLDGFAQHRP